jgi:VanZ family protein
MISFIRKYFAKIYYPIIWSLIMAVLLCLPGTMLPSETKFSIPQFDKFVHAGMFGGFVFLWNLYLSGREGSTTRLLRSFFLIFLLANIYGIGSEYIQGCCIPLRDFDPADIIADMSGAGLAYGLSHLLLLPVDKT